MSAQPIQADNGQWYDPKYDGAGFVLHMLDDGRHVSYFFGGSVPGWFENPVWCSIQGRPRVDGALPLILSTGAVFGVPHQLDLDMIGTVEFERISDALIRALVDVRGNGKPEFSPAPLPAKCVFDLRRLV